MIGSGKPGLNLRDVLFLVVALFLASSWYQQYRDTKRVENALAVTHEQVKTWRDKAGRSNAQKQALELSYDEFRRTQSQVVDSLKSLKIKPRTVREATTITTTVTDTVYYRLGSPRVSFLDSGFVYNYRDSLALIKHSLRYGFLGLKTKYVVRALAFNPKTTITGLNHVEIVPRRNRVGVGVYAGYGFVISDGVVRTGLGAGVGVQIRF